MNIGVFASRDVPDLQDILEAFVAGRLDARVAIVVSNNSETNALRRARQAGVQAVHLSSQTHEDPAALDAAIRDVLVAADVNVVFLAGYWSNNLGPLVRSAFKGRVLDTSFPSSRFPLYSGGISREQVLDAILEAGEVETGLSVRLIDTFALVRECRVPAFTGDSFDDLKARVKAREKEFVVETLALIAKGEIRLSADGR